MDQPARGALLCLMSLAACDGAPTCGDGEIAIEGQCVSSTCTEDPWGEIRPASPAWFVDAAAESGGDGSQEEPFREIQAGLDAVASAGGGAVVLAAGTYAANLRWTAGDLQIVGRCPDLVTLDAQGGDLLDLAPSEPDARVALRRLSATGWLSPESAAITVRAGHATLGAVVLHDGEGTALSVSAGAELAASDLRISEVQGTGIAVEGGSLVASGLQVGPLIPLLDEPPGADAETGTGLVQGVSCINGDLDLRAVELREIPGVGVQTEACDVSIADAVIEDISPPYADDGGEGVWIVGGTGDLSGLVIEDVVDAGLRVGGAATVALNGARVQRVRRPPGFTESAAIHIADRSLVSASDVEIADVDVYGAVIHSARLELERASVRVARRSSDFALAAGVAVYSGEAELSLLDVAEIDGPGLIAVNRSDLRCSACEVRDTSFASVMARDSSVELSDGSILADTVEDIALGGGMGLVLLQRETGFVEAPPTVTVRDSTLSGHTRAAAFVKGDGAFVFSGNDVFVGGESDSLAWPRLNGIFVSEGPGPWDGLLGVLIEGNTFSGASQGALFLDRASAQISGNTWTDNAVDLVQQGCDGTDSPPPGYEEAPRSELCPIYAYPVDLPAFYLWDVPISPDR